MNNNPFKRLAALSLSVILLIVNLSGCSIDISQNDVDSLLKMYGDATRNTENENAGDVSEETEGLTPLTDLPTEWDLTDLYADHDAFLSDMDYVITHSSEVNKYKGTLNNADNILALTEDEIILKMDAILSKATIYTRFLSSLDASDSWAKQASAKYNAAYAKYLVEGAFIEPEIMELPLEERKTIFSDERLAPYAYYYHRFTDPDNVALSEEASRVETLLEQSCDQAENAYLVFDNVDLKRPDITFPDGTTAKLTDDVYSRIMYSTEYTQDFRKEACLLRSKMRIQYENTYAELLTGEMKRNWAKAQARGFDTTLDYCLHENDVEPETFYKIIDFAHSLFPKIHEYYAARKKALGLSEMGMYDIYIPVASIENSEADYETCVNLGREAISIWGDEYLDSFDSIITKAHVDVYPSDTKESGAYEYLLGNEGLPYVFLNFDGQLPYASTIVHEMGHAVYSDLSAKNQNTYNCSPEIFTQEVASTANEVMFYKHMTEQAKDDKEKLYWTQAQLTLFLNTILGQCMFSEFEDYCYKTIEAGDSLSAEAMDKKWIELLEEYYGDSVAIMEEDGINWARIPHFYNSYYVYKYATSLTYATAICNKAVNDESAKDDYIKFLKAGNSAKPSQLLKTAGVDPLDEQTYEGAKEYIDSLIDQFIELSDQ